MNRELCIILRDRIKDLPFVDLISGVVRTQVYNNAGPNNKKLTIKMPVSIDAIGANCEGKEVAMLPDTKRKSVIYFEENGISTYGMTRRNQYASNIRLVCWLNRANVSSDMYTQIGTAEAQIIDRLTRFANPLNAGIFTRLTCSLVRVVPQNDTIFSKYTYDEQRRQYLSPPYDFFAIDLRAQFIVSAACLSGSWSGTTCS